MDLVVEGKALVNNQVQHCCIGVTNGVITDIKKSLHADQRIKINQGVILPGGVDPHVHFRDPGFTHKEDFFTGSLSAAFGGTTCIFDMPNTNPPVINITTIKEKKELAEKKSVVDFGLGAAITSGNTEELRELSQQCQGFKIFLGSTTNSLLIPSTLLPNIFSKLNGLKTPIFFHAEDEQCLQKTKRKTTSLKEHAQSRPASCEQQSMELVLELANETQVNAHLCHLSSGEGAELVRQRSNLVTVGVTPHHLFFNCIQPVKNPAMKKVNPPIRTNYDQELLTQALTNNIISLVESDHAPHTLEEKQQEFQDAPSGIPGVETRYPLLLQLAQQGQCSLQQVVQWCCEQPAKVLQVKKGRIAVGMDADLIAVDLKTAQILTADTLHSKCGWTPFEGFKGIIPSWVMLRGKTLIQDGELQQKSGYGRCYGE